MPNIKNYCLGRKAVIRDSRTLKLSNYLTIALPPPPAQIDWTQNTSEWGMMKNDQLGCCTIAAAAHAIQIWSKNSSLEITVTDDDILAAYEAWDGYNPADPTTDTGGIELNVLNNFKKLGLAQHKLLAFASILTANTIEVQQAISLFGGIYIGVGLPLSAQTQGVWDVDVTADADTTAPWSWGGHAVFVVAYDQVGLTCITWGILKKMTWAFWHKYCDEAYALIGQDWFSSSGVDPTGLNISQLEMDLQQIH